MRFAPQPRWILVALAALALLAPQACGPIDTNPPPVADGVSVRIVVEGLGRVTYGANFACTDDCTWKLPADEAAALGTAAGVGQVFVAWDGPCPAALNSSCERVFAEGDVVTARFAPHALRLAIGGDGEGVFRIVGGPVVAECDADCGIALDQPLALAITHDPQGSARTTLGPWTGACAASALANYCLVSVSGATDVGKTWRHPPLANPDPSDPDDPAYRAVAGTPLVLPAPGVLANDEDTPGDVLTAELLTGVAHGTLELRADGGFTYAAPIAYVGTDAFTYRARDAIGNVSGPATVTITVVAPPPAVLGIVVTPDAATLVVGDDLALDATVQTVGGAPDGVDWSSSDDAVATVDDAGLVAAVAPGPATITATSVFDAAVSASAAITVVPVPAVVSVTVDPDDATLLVGDDLQLTAVVDAVGGADDAVTWTSDDEDVATVDDTGLVTAVAVGVATITATSDFDPTVAGTATITVVPVPAVVSVTVAPATAQIVEGATAQLTATVVTVGGADDAVTWTSDDEAVATVDAAGLVTAVAAGTATITATSDFDDTISDSAAITVVAPAIGGISVTPGTNSLQTIPPGNTVTLTASFSGVVGSPSLALTWGSSNTAVATVAPATATTALVTAAGPGSATITATSVAFPAVSGSAGVTVIQPAIGSITVTPANSTLNADPPGNTVTLTATISGVVGTPSLALTWGSSNTAVATVAPATATTALVTAAGPGSATITATSVFDPTVSGSAGIDVPAPSIGGVVVTPAAATLEAGEDTTLTASFTDVVGSPDLTLTWASSATGVATVAPSGPTTAVVSAIAAGDATVTATSVAFPAVSDDAAITVVPVPEVVSVTVTPDDETLQVGADVQLTAIVVAVGGADESVTWTSDDETVATVDATGLVLAQAPGTATITATSDFDPTVSGSATVTVEEAAGP